MKDEIDEIDSKIICDLLRDGRKSFKTIASECNVTRHAIWEHYNRMKNAGIIVGSTILLNWKSIGYKAVTSLFLKIDFEKVEEFYEFVQTMPGVLYNNPLPAVSKFNYSVTLTHENFQKFNEISSKISKHEAVFDSKLYVWTDVKHIPENILKKETKNKKNTHKLEPLPLLLLDIKVETDDRDREIIELLLKNSRDSFSKIAKKIGLSTDTVIRRYRKLVKCGIIRSVIQINPIKIGYKALFRVGLISKFKSDDFLLIENLANVPDVVEIVKTGAGMNMDFEVGIMVKDIEKQLEILDQINRIGNLQLAELHLTKIADVFPSPGWSMSTF